MALHGDILFEDGYFEVKTHAPYVGETAGVLTEGVRDNGAQVMRTVALGDIHTRSLGRDDLLALMGEDPFSGTRVDHRAFSL